jgi:tetratricopeptide (TPR) repeat protein
MPLQKFFAQRKLDIENFLAATHVTLLRLAADSEAESMVIKLLSAVDASPKNTDIFIGCDHTFDGSKSFYPRTLARLAEEHKKVELDLEKKGIRCSVSDKLSGPEDQIESAFAREVSRFRNDISTYGDHLVFVFGVPEPAQGKTYRASLALLLNALSETGVKVIALDNRSHPLLAEFAKQRDDVWTLEFDLSPEVIEQAVKDKLTDSSCTSLQRMRCLTMLAGFAMARKEFETALGLGKDVLSHFQKEGNRQEEAAAGFNLANTYYRKEDYKLARQYYERSLEIALDQKMHNLAEQNLINIGNTWFMMGENAHALAYYEGAQRWSKAISNPFGVCQALELIGLAKQKVGQKLAARNAWQESLTIYRGMPPELGQMAKAGEAQVLSRLQTLGGETDFALGSHSNRGDCANPAAR